MRGVEIDRGRRRTSQKLGARTPRGRSLQLFGRVSGQTTARSLLRLYHEALHFLCVSRRSDNGGLSVSLAVCMHRMTTDFAPDGTRYAEATNGM